MYGNQRRKIKSLGEILCYNEFIHIWSYLAFQLSQINEFTIILFIIFCQEKESRVAVEAITLKENKLISSPFINLPAPEIINKLPKSAVELYVLWDKSNVCFTQTW